MSQSVISDCCWGQAGQNGQLVRPIPPVTRSTLGGIRTARTWSVNGGATCVLGRANVDQALLVRLGELVFEDGATEERRPREGPHSTRAENGRLGVWAGGGRGKGGHVESVRGRERCESGCAEAGAGVMERLQRVGERGDQRGSLCWARFRNRDTDPRHESSTLRRPSTASPLPTQNARCRRRQPPT